MKQEMGIAIKMTSSVLDREHAARAFAHKKRANQLVFMVCGEKRQLELSQGHENWHKGHIRNFGRLEALGFDHSAARKCMRMKRTNQFVIIIFGEKLQLELQEDHKYWHVGEVECC